MDTENIGRLMRATDVHVGDEIPDGRGGWATVRRIAWGISFVHLHLVDGGVDSVPRTAEVRVRRDEEVDL